MPRNQKRVTTLALLAVTLAGCSEDAGSRTNAASGSSGLGSGGERALNGASSMGGLVGQGGVVTLGGRASGSTSNAGGPAGTSPSTSGNSATGGRAAIGGSTNAGGNATGGYALIGGAPSNGGKATGAAPSTGGITNGEIGAGAAGGSASGTGGSASGTGGSSSSSGTTPSCDDTAALHYDEVVLCDKPVAYWAMTKTSGSEADLSGNNNTGTIRGGTLATTSLPNADPSVVFNGSSQYLTIPSTASFSVPTTGDLTWEAWIQPSVLQFPNDSGSGYVDWMGKCADYSPTCEWEARMYSTTNSENRCNRISAYIFNPSAGLGSAADWQPTCGLIQANQWYHVVGEYTTQKQPANCANTASYPGSIEIWVNGVKWDQSRHGSTGCMSQYDVVPRTGSSPLNIGTMAHDGWFPGAIAKVAIYDYLLTSTQVTNHYVKMTGRQPTGSCGNDCSF